MLTFRGGREVQGYPVSNKQAISEINESLGLGIEQFMAGKKIAMLNTPATYLQERNAKLAGLSTAIKNDYDAALGEIQALTPGYENSLWVKQRAAEDAFLKEYLLYRGDTKHYFPKNDLMEKSTGNEIGGSLYVAYLHRAARLAKTETKASETNKHNNHFPINRGTDNPDVDDFATGELKGAFEGESVLFVQI